MSVSEPTLPDIAVEVQSAPFSMAYGYESALRQRTDIGAIVTFTGLVRDFNETPDVTGLTLEHYPGMTERTLTQIAEQAWQRWRCRRCVLFIGWATYPRATLSLECWWQARTAAMRLRPAISLWII